MRRHYPSVSRHFLDIHIANSSAGGGGSGYGSVQPLQSSTTTTAKQPSTLCLSPPQKEESTRVQLQKQRLSEQQHAIVVSQKIPGFKTSAAFFASLRTNLSLNASSATPPPSPLSTPPSLATSTHSLPPPSPLSGPVMDNHPAPTAEEPPISSDPLAGVPELKTFTTTDEDEKIDALKLIADGVAQMRQQANNALIFHPLNMALLVALLALLCRVMLNFGYDNIAVATTCTGVIFAALAGTRYLTQGYIWRAENINFEWLGDGADVVVTKFGDDLIGAAVVEWVSGESGSGKTRRKKAWRAEVKAWTVRMRYRRKGVGAALLEEVVKEAKRKGAESVDFAEDHANALRVLPGLYNKSFDQRESRARDLLLDLQATSPSKHRRKRGGSNGGSR